MADRLAVARRAYSDVTLVANAAYAAACARVDTPMRAAMRDAARVKGAVVPREVISAWLEGHAQARADHARRIAAVLTEVQDAVAEALAAGTFHWEIAPAAGDEAA